MSNKREVDLQTQLQLARTAPLKRMQEEISDFISSHPEARAELDSRVFSLARETDFCERELGIIYEDPTIEDSVRLRYYAILELKGKMDEGYTPGENVH